MEAIAILIFIIIRLAGVVIPAIGMFLLLWAFFGHSLPNLFNFDNHYRRPHNQYTNKPNNTAKSYQNNYQATPFLTQNELKNYRTLNEAAMRKGYMVNCKVRLADIVKPRNDPQYMANFSRIKAKHVDFVIVDQNMRIKAIIELDDSSHDRADRKQRDQFVDSILRECGYKVIHTRYITSNILDTI